MASAREKTTTATTGENKSARDIVESHYRDCISRRISESVKSDLTWALSMWGSDVVCYAIDSAVDAGKANGAYFSAILRCYQKAGVQTLEDAQARDRAHRGGGKHLPTDDIAPAFIDEVGRMLRAQEGG